MYYHHIYFMFENTKSPFPEESTIIESHIKENCSNLQYRFWDFKDACEFVKVHYPMFTNFMELETNYPIIKCDFFRYLLMYHFGGVYTDLDFISIRPFDNFIKLLKENKINYFPNTITNPAIFLSEEWLNSSTFTNTLHNGILISLQSKHPFWLKLIFDIYENVINKACVITSKDDVYNITGPKKLNMFYNTNSCFFKDICVLPYFYCCPYISIKNDGTKHLYNQPSIDVPKLDNSQWVFFNIKEYKELPDLCPNSFFVCIYLNTGSMWK